ncbi:hypothetical protein [Nostoc sp. CHAB 5715]|uniref:hypothetical protein n=1 Tax=Nostoc sp. CHAB 5715 TaxID=2780400 RepID=UPI001E53CF60|nr:hypothetical protein [Nostoc sp. CHAB 5715]MCC5623054.1 hypothetical protein [Nostoc sp. CHAB 5715]
MMILPNSTTTSTTESNFSDTTTSLVSFLSDITTIIGFPIAIVSLTVAVMSYRSQQEVSENSLRQPVSRGELNILNKLMIPPNLIVKSIAEIFPDSAIVENIQQKLSNTQKSLDEKLKFLQERCQNSQKAGIWLLKNSKNISKEASEKVLGSYSTLKIKRNGRDRYTQEEFSLFSEHIEIYLKLVGHCLNDCRPNALEKALTNTFSPIIDDLYVEDYEKALRSILESIAMRDLSQKSRKELKLYINLLIDTIKDKSS